MSILREIKEKINIVGLNLSQDDAIISVDYEGQIHCSFDVNGAILVVEYNPACGIELSVLSFPTYKSYFDSIKGAEWILENASEEELDALKEKAFEGMTPYELYREGFITKEDISDYIDKWHKSDSTLELHKYLGMTEEVYAIYLEKNYIYVHKPFNNDKLKEVSITYNDKEYICSVFEEGSAEEAKEEMGYNLIAIEFNHSTPSPFNSEERISQYKGNDHYGYVTDVTGYKTGEFYLLVHDYGWGETDIVTPGSEEYNFVKSILDKAGALILPDFQEYDSLYPYVCLECGFRGEEYPSCPECNSKEYLKYVPEQHKACID